MLGDKFKVDAWSTVWIILFTLYSLSPPSVMFTSLTSRLCWNSSSQCLGPPPPLHSLLCSLLNMHPWWQSMKGVIMCVFDSFIIFYLKAFFYFTYQRKFNFPPLLMLSPIFLRLNACPLLRKGKASHEGSTKSGTLSWNRTNPQLPLPKLNKVSLHRKLVPKSHFLHK